MTGELDLSGSLAAVPAGVIDTTLLDCLDRTTGVTSDGLSAGVLARWRASVRVSEVNGDTTAANFLTFDLGICDPGTP